ncbi:MAG: aminoacetone oxidase family FAD-binding enzyme [Anaerovoracaceae bacterium]
MDFDILIAGGGASGLAAAISAARFAKSVSPARSLRIGLLEKKEIPGKKLSATGNGRCNLSNAVCSGRETVDGFFASVGLVTRIDEAGRMYPYGEEAAEVSALLTETALSYDVKIMTDCQVTQIRPVEDARPAVSAAGKSPAACVPSGGFIVEINRTGSRQLECRILLLSMGGKSYSVFGTSGDGYGFARRLGHTVTRLAPSLVPIQVTEDLQGLAGVRTKADVTLLHLGKPVARETGEVQFNKDCLSGICIMNLSRLLVLNPEKPFAEAFREYELQLDLLPEFRREEVTEILRQKSGSLQTLVKKKLATWIEAAADEAAAPEKPAAADPAAMADRLKSLTFSVCGTKGWNDAQVTRGGVVLEEVDPETMESQLVPGLYFAGEILNFDGPCGGFNLHFAWESGIRAGKAMAAAALAVSSASKE